VASDTPLTSIVSNRFPCG